MDLRSGNEQLRRVGQRVDNLVNDIRDSLLSRTDTTVALSDNDVKGLLRRITNNLQNITINGNELVLDDILDLYDDAISQMDTIIKSREYNENEPLEPSEVDTFTKARDLLKASKDSKVTIIDEVYTEIIKAERSGELEKTYHNRNIAEYDRKIEAKQNEIKTNMNPIMDLRDGMKAEIEEFKKTQEIDRKLLELDGKITRANARLASIATELADPAKSDEEKEELKSEKAELENKVKGHYYDQRDIIMDSDPKAYKEYEDDGTKKQGSGESAKDFVARLRRDAFNPKRDAAGAALAGKVAAKLGKTIKVAEENTSTRKIEMKDANIQNRYFSGMVGPIPSDTELKRFIPKLEQDIAVMEMAMDEALKEKSELEKEKREEADSVVSLMETTPYRVKEGQKEISGFAKWRQRMAFRFANPRSFFKGREKIEQAMLAKKQRRSSKIDRVDVLKNIERDQRKFKSGLQVKAKAQNRIFDGWTQAKQQQKQSGRDGR